MSISLGGSVLGLESHCYQFVAICNRLLINLDSLELQLCIFENLHCIQDHYKLVI